MKTLSGVFVYSPKGPLGTKPVAAYSERAGAKAAPAPHSRLTRRKPRAAAAAARWSTSARPTPRPRAATAVVEGIVGIEHVHARGRHDAAGDHAVLLEESTHVIAPGIVDLDHESLHARLLPKASSASP